MEEPVSSEETKAIWWRTLDDPLLILLRPIKNTNIDKSHDQSKKGDQEGQSCADPLFVIRERIQISQIRNGDRFEGGTPKGDDVDNVEHAEGFYSTDDQRDEDGRTQKRQPYVKESLERVRAVDHSRLIQLFGQGCQCRLQDQRDERDCVP